MNSKRKKAPGKSILLLLNRIQVCVCVCVYHFNFPFVCFSITIAKSCSTVEEKED